MLVSEEFLLARGVSQWASSAPSWRSEQCWGFLESLHSTPEASLFPLAPNIGWGGRKHSAPVVFLAVQVGLRVCSFDVLVLCVCFALFMHCVFAAPPMWIHKVETPGAHNVLPDAHTQHESYYLTTYRATGPPLNSLTQLPSINPLESSKNMGHFYISQVKHGSL